MNHTTLLRYYLPFVCIALVHLGAILYGASTLVMWTKPLLMPVLMLAVGLVPVSKTHKTGMWIALFFGWLGDILLMYAHEGSQYFLGGLGSFLVGHLAYLFLFSKLRKPESPRWKAWIIILALLVLGGMLWVLWPGLGGLKIPVLVYGLVLSSMAVSAAHTGHGQSRVCLGVGGFLFLLSDAMIAINKFSMPVAGAHWWIMLTYILAQGALIYGVVLFLLQKREQHTTI